MVDTQIENEFNKIQDLPSIKMNNGMIIYRYVLESKDPNVISQR